MSIVVRQAQTADFEMVYQLVQLVFSMAEHTDGNEQEVVRALWHHSDYAPWSQR